MNGWVAAVVWAFTLHGINFVVNSDSFREANMAYSRCITKQSGFGDVGSEQVIECNKRAQFIYDRRNNVQKNS